MLKTLKKSNGRTGTKILLEAMSQDKVHLARFILDALDGKIIDAKTESAQTPLIYSVLLPDYKTRSKFMELLLQRGASVNCQDESGRTPLSYACENGYLDAVKILVRNNADPDMVDAWGNTALMYAAVAGHSLVIEFLVRAFKRLGLQIDRQNKVGNSAVKVAKFLGHTECFFALTSNAKKGRENDGSPQGDALPQVSLECTAKEKRFEKKLEPLVKTLEGLQTCAPGDYSLAPDEWQSTPAGRRRSSLILKSRLHSMDSIEEFDRENDSSPSSPHGLVFSGVLIPKPPPRTNNQHSPVRNIPKTGERFAYVDDHLLPLGRGSEHQMPALYSPRLGTNNLKTCAPSATALSPLDILLTPILTNNKSGNEPDKEKRKTLDFSVRRFNDSYYQKRCSLPSSILSPTPPDRALMPSRKTKTMRTHAPPPTSIETLETKALVATSTTTTFSELGNKLLRRFTFPDFKKGGKVDLQACAQNGEDPSSASARLIPRSETYPQSTRHPRVGSEPSIDSISAVKCEFDFHFRTPPS